MKAPGRRRTHLFRRTEFFNLIVQGADADAEPLSFIGAHAIKFDRRKRSEVH